MLLPPRCMPESAVLLCIFLSTAAAPRCTLNISQDGQAAPSPFDILSAVDAARQTLAPIFLRKHLEKNAAERALGRSSCFVLRCMKNKCCRDLQIQVPHHKISCLLGGLYPHREFCSWHQYSAKMC